MLRATILDKEGSGMSEWLHYSNKNIGNFTEFERNFEHKRKVRITQNIVQYRKQRLHSNSHSSNSLSAIDLR